MFVIRRSSMLLGILFLLAILGLFSLYSFINADEKVSLLIADSFDFPLGAPDGIGYGHGQYNGYDVQNPDLTRTSGCYGEPISSLWHAGEDWFERGNSSATAGDPVKAVANGIVKFADPSYDYGRGAVVIIEHQLPDGKIIYSQYGHLSNLQTQENQTVTKGQIIGFVFDQGANSHLHWEIRSFEDGRPLCASSGIPGPGYTYPNHPGEGQLQYHNPSAFVHAHRNLTQATNVSVALIIDATGSMYTNDPLGMRREAAKAFIDASQIGDKIAVVAFDTDVYHFQSLLLIESQADKETLKTAVDQIGDWGDTDLNIGLNGGFTELLSDASNNQKVAIFLTDGLHTAVNPFDPQSYLQYQTQDWPVYTIGLSDDADEDLLSQIADETGGLYSQLDDPNDLQQLYFALSQHLVGSQTIFEKQLEMYQGQSHLLATTVDRYQTMATFFVSWPGSEVSTTLVSPSGRFIDSSSLSADVYHAKDATYEIYTVSYPEVGEWKINLYGTSLAAGGEMVYVRVTSQGPSYIYLPVVLHNSSHIFSPPPFMAYNPVPFDNSVNQSTFVTFSWDGGDPNNDPVTYDVYLGHTPDTMTLVYANSPIDSYYPGSLEENTTYYWKIITQDIYGASTEGATWKFTTSNIGTLTPTHTPSVIETPSGTPTATPSPTLTPLPTETATPSPTSSATSTTTPFPTPPPPIELLGPFTNNGGFESGNMTGWIVLNGTIDVTGEFVRSGIYSIHGTPLGDESEGQPPVVFYKDLSLEPYRIWIDAGLGIANYEGWFHDGNSEYHRYVVHFFDQFGTELTTPYDTGWVRVTGGGSYVQFGEQRGVPVNTSYIRVEVQLKRTAGSYTDIDVDDMTLTVQFNNP